MGKRIRQFVLIREIRVKPFPNPCSSVFIHGFNYWLRTAMIGYGSQ